MTAGEKSLELVIIGCGEVYQSLCAESSIYANDQEKLQCIPLSGPAAIADQADSLLATLDSKMHQLFIAVDANALNHARLELYGRARLRGFRMISLVHPTAYISPAASMGDNVWVGPGAHIAAGCKVGSNTLIGVHSRLDLDAMVGTHVWIGAGCSIGNGSSIGNHCVLGTDVKLRAGTRLGKYSLLEQPGPWSGEISGGLLPETTLLNPQKLLVQATLIVCEHEQVMKPMRQFDASDKLRTAQMHLFGAINKSQEVMGPWNGKWHAGTYSEKNFARTVGPSNSHLRKLVT